MLARTFSAAPLVILLSVVVAPTDAVCKFPGYMSGSWYHRLDGYDTSVEISASRGTWKDTVDVDRKCYQVHQHPLQMVSEGANYTLIVASGDSCYRCVDIVFRSALILQFREESCMTTPDLQTCGGMTKLPGQSEMITMFKKVSPLVDCIDSIEGLFQFSYEIDEQGGGICNDSRNTLEACQTPGSPNYDNKDFTMTYNRCPDVTTSFKATIRYKCMGSWSSYINGQVYTFVGLKDDSTGVLQDQFKCLMTLRDQHSADNSIRWGMTRFGDCRDLKSLEASPIRILLRRVAPVTKYMAPQCVLPRNVTGNWFTQGIQFSSDVRINDTHIYYRTMLSQFDYEETWFSCQANLGTRYLMTKVVVGRCEVSLTCFDLAPRLHGLVRYRVGRSTKLPYDSESRQRDERFLTNAFTETCSWQWLTFSRENVDWKYEVLIQNPPSPVTCPIGGRYTFQQKSTDPFQLYDTRIRGVTLAPRHQIKCLTKDVQAVVQSCYNDRSKIEIDASYCETVDFAGKPIGEYDEPDHILTCVGYWLEDMQSYMVTYDEEDAVSRFRCWVYERISWTEVALSRAETARCPKEQTAFSSDSDGAGLHIKLDEAERLYDDCPPRFDPGMLHALKPVTIYMLDSSGCVVRLSVGFYLMVVIGFYMLRLFVKNVA